MDATIDNAMVGVEDANAAEEMTAVPGQALGMMDTDETTPGYFEDAPEADEAPRRDPKDRVVYKLSVKLIDTYKYINKVYYEAKAKRMREQAETGRGGVYNQGFDDENYDYIVKSEEVFNERYILKNRMGKGSFGQVVRAYDRINQCEVAIKIIKSRKPFLMQAKTEVKILDKILEKDNHQIVRMINHFVFRDHMCLVFELLSYNLYELLRNTRFRGVSLNLIRKLSYQLLVALQLLAQPDVNIIHCDLKPENILLCHPRRSTIKLIDFGSSCFANETTYTYIQSRFYRSPEVLFGLPYTTKIDMWSLGCVAVEMHTGEPLFGGLNQADQVCRIIDVLGLPPVEMLRKSPDRVRSNFFERVAPGDESRAPQGCDFNYKVFDSENNVYYVLKRTTKENPKTLEDIIGVYSNGPGGRRVNEDAHTVAHYELFVDFIKRMIVYDPEQRASPTSLLSHPYLLLLENRQTAEQQAVSTATASISAKDVDRDRRSSEENGSNKIRSHSAPQGISYTRIFSNKDDNNVSNNNNNPTTS